MSTPTVQVPQLVVSVRDLTRQPGNLAQQSFGFEAPDGVGDQNIIAVPLGSAVNLDLLLESVMEGILASGSVQADAQGHCGRCLGPVKQHLQVTFQELYCYPERAVAAGEAGAELDSELQVVDETIDLNAPVRDALVLALPFQPLCQSDCAGLCAQCGQALADQPDHQHEQVDPRWSALEQLLLSRVEKS